MGAEPVRAASVGIGWWSAEWAKAARRMATLGVVAAAEAGKHVLCQKPLALTVQDALRASDACAKKVDPMADPLVEELVAFAQNVRESTPPEVGPEEATRVVAVLEAVGISAREGRAVDLKELYR